MATQDEKPSTSSTDSEQVDLPSTLRHRHVSGVTDDVDFIMEHLNDPNFDLKSRPQPTSDKEKYPHGGVAESQLESDKHSAGPRDSTTFEFDE
jgi:hypothetical protein